MSRPNQDCEVLIVGMGPTGAALAGLLGAQGVNTLIVDREADLLDLPRAVHFDGEIMRLFQNMGLASSLLPKLRPSAGMQYVNADGLLMLERKPAASAGPHGWANNYLFHQPDLERALRDHLKRFSCVTVMNSTEALALHPAQDHVDVELRAADETAAQRVRAKWVVGCDGARSLVRESIGGAQIDLGLHQEWLVVDVELLEPVDLPAATVQYCDPARPVTFVNVTGKRRRWEIMIMPGDDAQAMREPAMLWPLLARWLRPGQARLVRSAIYTFHSLIAERWRLGRMLLAGDSAHQTPPFLGQGMCAGLRDAANLAWKLALVLRGACDEDLIDTYPSERLPHVRTFIDTAIRLGNIIQTTDPQVAADRDRGFAAAGPQQIVNLSPALGSGWHCGESPCGEIVGQPRLSDGRLLDDAIPPHHFVHLSATPIETAGAAQLEEDPPQAPRPHRLVDAALAPWLDSLGVKQVLLRPDRYVAAVSRSEHAPLGSFTTTPFRSSPARTPS